MAKRGRKALVASEKLKEPVKVQAKQPIHMSPSEPAMVTLRAMINEPVGLRKTIVPAKDVDKVIARFMQTGFKERLAHSTISFRVYGPSTIRYIDIEPVRT